MPDQRPFPRNSEDRTVPGSGRDVRDSNIDAGQIKCPACGLVVSNDTRTCPNDGTVLQIIEAGRTVPNHQFIRLIGSGGMGNVYEAEHVILRSRVAVKTLRAHLIETSAFTRFQREAQAANRLKHPNIVSVHDCGISEQGEPYMIMDLIDGETLDTVLKRGPMNVPDSLRIAREICAGVACAHEHGILHRDLKPSNVILEKNDGKTVARILDFGIAKILDSDDKGLLRTRTGDIFGTPAYMSPEQAEGRKLDQRSDIYSIGCMLYEMLTGQPPVIGKTAVEIMYKHVNETPLSLTQASLGQKFPPSLEKIVEKSLARDPANRFSSAQELQSALDAFAQGKAIAFGSQTEGSKKRRAKTVVFASVSAVLVGALALAVILGINKGATTDHSSENDSVIAGKSNPHLNPNSNLNSNSNSAQIGSSSAIQQAASIQSSVVPVQTATSAASSIGEGKSQQNQQQRPSDPATAQSNSVELFEKHNQMFKQMLDAAGPNIETVKDVPEFITDSSLEQLKHCKHLNFVDLSGCTRITDGGVGNLVGLQGLHTLELADTKITNAIVFDLNEFKQLRRLDLSGTAIYDQAVLNLRHDLPLQNLQLRHTEITDRSLASLHDFKSLVTLRLDDCQSIDNAGINSLKMPQLRELFLNHTHITDGIIPGLKDMPELRSLSLNQNEISGLLLRSIVDEKLLPKLSQLQIRDCQGVSQKDREYFLKNRPGCQLQVIANTFHVPVDVLKKNNGMFPF